MENLILRSLNIVTTVLGITGVFLSPTLPKVQVSMKILNKFIVKPGDSTHFKLKYNVDPNKLGIGAYGKVYLASNTASENIKVAIKTLSKKRINDQITAKITNEIKILQSLDHPNIVNYIETFESENNIYLVMEYWSGGDLLDKLHNSQNGYFSEEEVKKIMK